MRLPLNVTYADGRQVSTTAAPADFIAFERRYGVPGTSVLEFKTKIATDPGGAPLLDADGDPVVVVDMEEWSSRVRLEWIYFLAWSPQKRAGETKDDFDTWLDTVEDVVGDAGVDPTEATQPSEESPESPSAPDSTSTASPPTPISSKRSKPSSKNETPPGAPETISSA